MDVKKFEIFLLCADHGSLTVAADVAGYTQSGVSHIIKNLETEMGFPLLHRFHTGVAPTEDAKRLIPTMRELVSSNAQLEQLAASIKGVETGVVRVGTFSSISAHWMPGIIKGYKAAHPNVDVQIISGGGREIEEWIEHGRVDFGMCSVSAQSSFEWLPLAEDPYYAVLPLEHALASLDEFPIHAFHGLRFISVPEGIHHEIHKLLRRYHVKPDYYYTNTDDLTLINMIENGLGVGIFPKFVMRAYTHHAIKTIPLIPASSRLLGIALRSMKKAPPAVRSFLTYTKEAVETMLENDAVLEYAGRKERSL
ncbi:LysR family transcriptional regulator [Christensenellaceae bacterium OttesenSCG-928-M15]|nr:LysR family transcriptional regulator [Christensenellaceae bacterium OttesenSCG-928-M15]